MLIYVNGCSHTEENIINKDNASPYIEKSWAGFVMGKFHKTYSHYYEYTGKLKGTNILINEARSGAGNDYIFHKSLETICKLIKQGKTPDYVLIQWSGPNRRMHYDENGERYFVNLYDHTHFHVKFEPMASQQTIHYMFLLQEFLKNHNIAYFFIPYMALDESIIESSTYELIDMNHVIDFGLGCDIFFKGTIDYIIVNGLNRDAQGHPNEFGYKEIANKVHDSVTKAMMKNIL